MYGHFTWRHDDGAVERIHDALRGQVRQADDRNAEPSAGSIDAQSVRTAATAMGPGTGCRVPASPTRTSGKVNHAGLRDRTPRRDPRTVANASGAASVQCLISLAFMPCRDLPWFECAGIGRVQSADDKALVCQASGRGARKWARSASSFSSTSSSMGLPGAHIMVTTNWVRASGSALPSW